jgi:hypothetical protein
MPFAFISSDTIALVTMALVVLTALVHIALAIGVWTDAHALRVEKRYLYFLSPALWGMTTLVMGLVGAAVYWGINRSTFRRD